MSISRAEAGRRRAGETEMVREETRGYMRLVCLYRDETREEAEEAERHGGERIKVKERRGESRPWDTDSLPF
ncbi:hypothetical protein E2C01_057548 [Portunus trituberculatus]|uniref:Uncharacterized protein n=1 Tax=Portunus trituberculatus TaxID=210409 RepID=A0A5B7GTT6_PORTR|nr:hypothetical protein [Portunus trituberculatus]